MKCRDFRAIIDSYLSDELLTETNHDILRHLEECARCRDEIEGRREIRGRVKSAVKNSPLYIVDPDFASGLESRLRKAPIGDFGENSVSWLFRNSWIAAAAGLLILVTLGFLLINQFGNSEKQVDLETPSIPNLQRNDLVNIALGDHEHCAMRHDLEDPTFSLEEVSVKYKNLDKIVVPLVQKVLSKYDLVMAHGCKYKDTQFAHVVMKDQEKTLSVLIAAQDSLNETESDNLLRFSSVNPKYQVARYNTKTHAVFVISDIDEKRNYDALKVLSDPLRKHLGGRGQIQTALLSFY